MNQKFKAVILLGLTGACLTMANLTDAYAAEKSALNTYDRAAAADASWQKMHGDTAFSLEDTDPEYADMMKKYIYGDIAQQVKLTPVEAALVKLSVLTTSQNEKMLRSAVEEALAIQASPLQVREAVYHITPYVGFAKTASALEIMNDVFRARGVALPLPDDGTTNDKNRFAAGLKFQTDAYGERITRMRAAAPDYQKHLQDDLSAFCFGDIYTRKTLSLKEREMLTMAAIGTLGIEAQFRSHVNGTLAAGASKEEVIGVITAMNPYVGFPRTLWMLQIANTAIDAYNK